MTTKNEGPLTEREIDLGLTRFEKQLAYERSKARLEKYRERRISFHNESDRVENPDGSRA
jgi:hypothetical protein